MYEVVIMFGENGYYTTEVCGAYDNRSQACERAAELRFCGYNAFVRQEDNMAIRIEDDCCGCALPCINCGRSRAVHHYCDHCDEETELYIFEGQELCIDCIKKLLEKVRQEEP